jgi:hypothetical protein
MPQVKGPMVKEMHVRCSLRKQGASFLGWLLVGAMTLPAAAIAGAGDSLEVAPHGVAWEFSVGGYYYAIPSEDDILVLVATGDRGALHLEARYNYEDLRTASAFAGWNLATGDAFTAEITPMAGVAFGRTTGLVPALEMSLAYGMVDFYGEGEYMVDPKEKSNNFFYSWLELGLSPTDIVRFGLTAQRTRLYQTPLGIDRGVFAQLTPALLSVVVYAFNPFTDSWFLVLGARFEW